MTEADLATYGIRNDGDLEKVVYVGSNSTEVVKKKRSGVPGYTVTVPLDPKTGKVPWQACKQAKIAYDEGYDKAAVEADAVRTAEGLQKLVDEKSAAGFRKVVLLAGTYRISHKKSLFVPSGMTLDLGKAVLKQNGFTGAKSCLVRIEGATDAHLVGGRRHPRGSAPGGDSAEEDIDTEQGQRLAGGSRRRSRSPSGMGDQVTALGRLRCEEIYKTILKIWKMRADLRGDDSDAKYLHRRLSTAFAKLPPPCPRRFVRRCIAAPGFCSPPLDIHTRRYV